MTTCQKRGCLEDRSSKYNLYVSLSFDNNLQPITVYSESLINYVNPRLRANHISRLYFINFVKKCFVYFFVLRMEHSSIEDSSMRQRADGRRRLTTNYRV